MQFDSTLSIPNQKDKPLSTQPDTICEKLQIYPDQSSKDTFPIDLLSQDSQDNRRARVSIVLNNGILINLLLQIESSIRARSQSKVLLSQLLAPPDRHDSTSLLSQVEETIESSAGNWNADHFCVVEVDGLGSEDIANDF